MTAGKCMSMHNGVRRLSGRIKAGLLIVSSVFLRISEHL